MTDEELAIDVLASSPSRIVVKRLLHEMHFEFNADGSCALDLVKLRGLDKTYAAVSIERGKAVPVDHLAAPPLPPPPHVEHDGFIDFTAMFDDEDGAPGAEAADGEKAEGCGWDNLVRDLESLLEAEDSEKKLLKELLRETDVLQYHDADDDGGPAAAGHSQDMWGRQMSD
jgi:hypothetical protein